MLRKRMLPRPLFMRALVIFMLGITLFFSASLVLSVVEQPAILSGRFQLIDLMYETMSAFGTVGVTSASTPNLAHASKLVLVACMFIGRVGPASFAIGLSLRRRRAGERIYPEGRTFVG